MSNDETIAALLSKAEASLSVASELLEQGHADFSVSRAYYSMFYAAEAALLARGLSFSKHSAVIARFGLEYAKSGDIDPKHLKALQKGFALRNQGDYSVLPVAEEEGSRLLEQARALVAAVRTCLERQGAN